MGIYGTTIFDGPISSKGYPLNKMCFSFNSAECRNEFVGDELAYCKKFGLSDEQIDAVAKRDILKMLELGGNAYYLAKLAGGVLGLDIQDIGALQTGMTKEEFKAKLVKAGEE
ncbi:MAG: protocatechuate 4,5-dioxygenase subunit alpha [Oscillospiraceae bacterium]|jgi:protocatechuate 4,5-dioxygenase alpha chain|nr:protocatechuate 4,5-dioxygenase subunit alpha [Oscillospiraceae bacterium]